MNRTIVWAISALIAVPVFFITDASGMPAVFVLVLTFIGALAGSFIGTLVTRRR